MLLAADATDNGKVKALFSVIAYFILAYAITGTLGVLICARLEKENLKKQKKAKRIITVLFLLLPCLPYAVVAVQTSMFRAAMRSPVRQVALETGMVRGDAQITRILSITPWKCDVEVVEPCSPEMCCNQSGQTAQDADVLTLTRSGSGWKLQSCDTVWSDCGNADGNTFPPYNDGGL